MKFFNSLLLILLSVQLFAQPEIHFEQKIIKLPKTKAGKPMKFHYVFTNDGDAPLLIQEAKTSCSCTRISFPDKPIMPTQSDTIFVSFDTQNKVGYQDRTIEIFSNAKNSPAKIRFKIVIDNPDWKKKH